MSDLLEYKCPCCGGRIEFSSASQQMKCPFCDSEFSVESLQAMDNVLNEKPENDMTWESAPDAGWADGETDGMRVYSCQSCGGQIIADETTAASKCPYCDNPIVMTGQFSGDLRPDLVIPFKISKEAAVNQLKQHFQGKKLLPKAFRSQHQIEEIKGVYVPVWLFDAGTDSRIVFQATKRRTWSDEQYNYIETSYYSAVRAGTLAFKGVPVDGSTKMDDDLMESIEPFDLRGAVDFQTAYLSGYLADKYDVTAEDSVDHANKRIKRSVEIEFTKTVQGYNTVEIEQEGIRLKNAKARYALYPVWLLNIKWEGQKFTFAMNGQTGKFVGDLPLDKGAAAGWFLGVAAAVSAVAFGAMMLISMM